MLFLQKEGAGTFGINTFKKSCASSCSETNVAGSGQYCCNTDFCNASVINIGSRVLSALAILFAFLFV